MPTQRRARRPYDWFTEGRRQAYYQPGPSPFAAIAAPAMQGAARGLGTYMGQRDTLTGQLNAGQPVTPTSLETVPPVAPTSLETVPPGTPPGAVPGQNPLAPTQPWSDPWAGNRPLAPDQPWARNPPPLTPQERAKRRQQQYLWQWLSINSSRALKDDITRADEQRSLREVMQTPTYSYKYKSDGPGDPQRLGPMAEEVPPGWQVQMGDVMGIKMSPYLGALHAAVRALGRETQTLRQRLDARDSRNG